MEKFEIRNFKCFNKREIELNNLTVFAGANGNGKSTAIQALLFLRRTIEHCGQWDDKNNIYSFNKSNGLNVELNGAYCLSLGNSGAVIPIDSSEIGISFNLKSSTGYFRVEYDGSNETQLWLKPVEVENTYKELTSIFKQEFYYLNAERFGPRVSQSVKFYDYENTGYKGEFVAQLLGDTEFTYRFKVDDLRKFEGVSSPNLNQQVNAWLNFIMPGVKIESSYDIDTLSAQIKIQNQYTKGLGAIAPNIGFGISYVLPIIVSGLIAKKETYLIVENPEAHLHPSAQSKIGIFLAMIAQTGTKVIVETHSDHIINGIQIAVAQKDIFPECVTINFFSQDDKERQPVVKAIKINSIGELSSWPAGFFDQSQVDFAKLFKMRTNG
jgi:predicted ATPase